MSNRTIKTCSIDGCEKKVHSRGWCKKHYTRWARHGDPSLTLYATTPEESFDKNTEWSGSCLIWAALKNNQGYGVISGSSNSGYAHRYAWERAKGVIPDGKGVDHICHNRACVNVKHLRLSTQAQNMANRSGASPNNLSSGARNVYRSRKRWKVQVKKNGVAYSFGTYLTIEEATEVAEQAREELFGEFAGKG